MYHPAAKLVPMKEVLTAEEMSYMSSEELNWVGAHFQHIVDFRKKERQERIDAENRRVYSNLVRSNSPFVQRSYQ